MPRSIKRLKQHKTMMDYKDFIVAGNKVLFVPCIQSALDDRDVMVVTIGKYRPYYTDGDLADPTPDEYNEDCYVEVEENLDECQLPLGRLFPIEPSHDRVLYMGQVREVYGRAKGCSIFSSYSDAKYDYVILKSTYGDELTVVEEEFVNEIRSINDLDEDELKHLFCEICRGSIYLSDYRNSLNVPDEEAMDAWEEFYRAMCDEYGERHADEHDTPQEFAEYFYNEVFCAA